MYLEERLNISESNNKMLTQDEIDRLERSIVAENTNRQMTWS